MISVPFLPAGLSSHSKATPVYFCSFQAIFISDTFLYSSSIVLLTAVCFVPPTFHTYQISDEMGGGQNKLLNGISTFLVKTMTQSVSRLKEAQCFQNVMPTSVSGWTHSSCWISVIKQPRLWIVPKWVTSEILITWGCRISGPTQTGWG